METEFRLIKHLGFSVLESACYANFGVSSSGHEALWGTSWYHVPFGSDSAQSLLPFVILSFWLDWLGWVGYVWTVCQSLIVRKSPILTTGDVSQVRRVGGEEDEFDGLFHDCR